MLNEFARQNGVVENTVIEVLNEDHGAKVIDFFKKCGVDTRNLQGTFTKSGGSRFRYYGIISGVFDNYSDAEFIVSGAKLIQLPVPEFPNAEKDICTNGFEYIGDTLMQVSDDNIDWKERVVFGFKCGEALSWGSADNMKEAETNLNLHCWSFHKPLSQETELTMQEIADKFGIEVEKLRIKK